MYPIRSEVAVEVAQFSQLCIEWGGCFASLRSGDGAGAPIAPPGLRQLRWRHRIDPRQSFLVVASPEGRAHTPFANVVIDGAFRQEIKRCDRSGVTPESGTHRSY